MKSKFKEFCEKYDVLVKGVLVFLVLFWVPDGIHLYNWNNTPMDSTSASSVVHDPDCSNCNSSL